MVVGDRHAFEGREPGIYDSSRKQPLSDLLLDVGLRNAQSLVGVPYSLDPRWDGCDTGGDSDRMAPVARDGIRGGAADVLVISGRVLLVGSPRLRDRLLHGASGLRLHGDLPAGSDLAELCRLLPRSRRRDARKPHLREPDGRAWRVVDDGDVVAGEDAKNGRSICRSACWSRGTNGGIVAGGYQQNDLRSRTTSRVMAGAL